MSSAHFLPYIFTPDGEMRLLGNLPSSQLMRAATPTWTQAGNDVMPESEWKEFDLWPDPIKIKDQNGKGACCRGDTLIRFADGHEDTIDQIKPTDKVLLPSIGVGTVVRSFINHEPRELFRISAFGMPHLRVTGNHKIITKNGDVPAREVSRDDWVCTFKNGEKKWSQILMTEREPYTGPVYNFEVKEEHYYVADGYGVANCNGHAAALGLECARNVSGRPHTPLSAWYVYAILCGGWDVGSNILDALKLLSDQGTCPETDLAYGTINPRIITASAKTEAGRFKLATGSQLTTFAEIMTAVQMLRPINLSIQVGNSFSNLDSEGVPGAARGPGNHAVTGFGGAKKSTKHGWLFKMPNSWGARWGLNGFCWLSEAHIQGVTYFEAYDILAAADDPSDPTNLPHVV